MKIHVVGTELLHVNRRTDGQTDMTNLVVACRSSANASRRRTELQNF